MGNLNRNKDLITKLENKIDQVRTALQAQQTNALDGQALADQLVSDKADLELELEKAKEKEAEIIRDRDKLKINLVALEDKLNDTNNEIESLKDGKLDKQKIKELIAEETA